MKNLHKNNIDEVTKQLPNISISDQNVPNIKKGQTVSFSLNDENCLAEILSRARKAAGKYKNTFNVQYHHSSNKLPNSYVDCVIDESCFQNAKQQELENWKSNNLYIEVAKSDQPLLNCRWVCSIKNIDDKQIPKAYLVVKGFEEQTSDILKDSSTCSKEGLRFVLALIAHTEWKINLIDIKTVFLQGEEIDR